MLKSDAAEEVALGFRTHSGWTAAVAVGRASGKPVVLDRCRMETADTRIAGSRQPFHAAEGLTLPEAEAHLRQCRESSIRLATDAARACIARLTRNGHQVVAAGILFASGRPLPELAATLGSHALIHTAEGEFFRDVFVNVCEHCSLPVSRVKEREVWEQGAVALGLTVPEVERLIVGLGRQLGPPWRQDEKLASLAAWIALASAAAKLP